jgi:uncharacterized DUF497 family protein
MVIILLLHICFARYSIVLRTILSGVALAKFEFSGWLIRWLFAQELFVFEWDVGNAVKSRQKHSVETKEAEEVFYDGDIFPLGAQTEPVVDEPRFGVLGKTFSGRQLHVAFTVRDGRVREISARSMHRRERMSYEQAIR